eukprot:SAG11_NODE_5729_length_1477_cov_1.164731_2_plen_139_part_00
MPDVAEHPQRTELRLLAVLFKLDLAERADFKGSAAFRRPIVARVKEAVVPRARPKIQPDLARQRLDFSGQSPVRLHATITADASSVWNGMAGASKLRCAASAREPTCVAAAKRIGTAVGAAATVAVREPAALVAVSSS